MWVPFSQPLNCGLQTFSRNYSGAILILTLFPVSQGLLFFIARYAMSYKPLFPIDGPFFFGWLKLNIDPIVPSWMEAHLGVGERNEILEVIWPALEENTVL